MLSVHHPWIHRLVCAFGGDQASLALTRQIRVALQCGTGCLHVHIQQCEALADKRVRVRLVSINAPRRSAHICLCSCCVYGCNIDGFQNAHCLYEGSHVGATLECSYYLSISHRTASPRLHSQICHQKVTIVYVLL